LLKKTLITTSAIILIASSFIGGVFFGASQRPAIEQITNVINKHPAVQQETGFDFSLFWDAWARLQRDFVDSSKLDPQKMIFGAIDGMVRSLDDPYTIFLPPEESKRFNDDIKGEFGGIGAEIGIRKNVLTIIAPLKDSPAESAGIKAGDKVLQINGTSTLDLTLEEAVSLIRGEKGTAVKLIISRDGLDETKEISIIRDTIKIPVLETRVFEGNIFYIHLFNFNENSTREFRNALIEMQKSEAQKLILDLRNNPGGFLNAAVDIASWFLPAGEIVAREKKADGTELLYRSVGFQFLEHTPTVILINEGSASASEIVAGALRDVRNVPLVGGKSFGKGSVQELEQLKQNASIKITIAKWLTPNGHSINDSGLEPDYAVVFPAEDVDAGDDPQLDAAIDLIRGEIR